MHHRVIPLLWLCVAPAVCEAAGTVAGTDIVNQVEVAWEIDSQPHTGLSNIVTITVVEVIDANVLVQTPERLVGPGVSDQPLYFTLTNTGNGSEAFELLAVLSLTGDGFDPLPSGATIVLDTDGDGVLSAADTSYIRGTNDPVLGPDEAVGLFLVTDIPPGLADGLTGFAALEAAAVTATGTPGQVFAGVGDTGVDVVLGRSGGLVSGQGEYLVGEISLSLTKVARVESQGGDSRPTPGAILTYAIQIAAAGTGSAGATLFRDPIPAHTLFIPGSLRLNGAPLTDAADGDSGEYVAATPEVVVRLGDIRVGDPTQLVEFSVSIQ